MLRAARVVEGGETATELEDETRTDAEHGVADAEKAKKKRGGHKDRDRDYEVSWLTAGEHYASLTLLSAPSLAVTTRSASASTCERTSGRATRPLLPRRLSLQARLP